MVGALSELLAGQASAKTASVKFAALVLSLATKYGRQLGPHKDRLGAIADTVTSFMKRSLKTAIGKL